MLNSAAIHLYTKAMGLTSSQLREKTIDESPLAISANGKDKKHKSRKSKSKSKRKSVEDEEEESAKALMRMRGANLQSSESSRHDDLLAASSPPTTESPGKLSSNTSKIADTPQQSSHGTKKLKKKKSKKAKKKKRERNAYDSPQNEEDEVLPQLPSTPPGQTTRSTSSPYRPSLSQAQHMLDDIPSSDEQVASFIQEFEEGNASLDAPDSQGSNIYDLPRQSPGSSDRDNSLDAQYLSNQLSQPNAAKKPKKQKKRRKSGSDDQDSAKPVPANGEGQHALDFDFDSSFRVNVDFSSLFGTEADCDMPIDPELHSIGASQPLADSKKLNNGDEKEGRKRKRKSRQNSHSDANKRRRMEELQVPSTEEAPYESPYAFKDDQEKMKDHVLPGLEDMQRRSSGSSYIADTAREGLEDLSQERLTSKKRKSKVDRDEERGRSNGELNGNRPGPDMKQSLKKISVKGGPFTADEVSHLEKFKAAYCKAHGMSDWHFNNLIQKTMRSNPEVTALYHEILNVFAYRPRMSVIKSCRRRFHNYTARGTWSAEDDEMLRQAIAEKGKAWKVIGAMIDRMPEDCRDRYRNYMFNSEHRNKEQWTDEEVRDLCTAILGYMRLIKEERRQANKERNGEEAADSPTDSDQEVEDMKMINWQFVSDRMGPYGGGRSRLQCNNKWAQLKRQEQKGLLLTIKEAEDIINDKQPGKKNDWRLQRAIIRAANMRTGDRYVFLQRILASNALTEGNIPWKSIGDERFREAWKSADKKAAWSKMKADIPDVESKDYREIANLLLTEILNEHRHELNDRWDPKVHGDLSAKPTTREKGREAPKKHKKKNGAQEMGGAVEITNHNGHEAFAGSDNALIDVDAEGDAVISSEEESAEGEESDYSAKDADRKSLSDEPLDREQSQPLSDEGVGPELAGKIQMLTRV